MITQQPVVRVTGSYEMMICFCVLFHRPSTSTSEEEHKWYYYIFDIVKLLQYPQKIISPPCLFFLFVLPVVVLVWGYELFLALGYEPNSGIRIWPEFWYQDNKKIEVWSMLWKICVWTTTFLYSIVCLTFSKKNSHSQKWLNWILILGCCKWIFLVQPYSSLLFSNNLLLY